jgi:5-methyltetrahydropteroyltriglutamate--homocysteine methyltransferase
MITTTVGSYPKVAEGAYSTTLIGAITKWQRKELSDAQLEATYRGITKAVIHEQEQAGLDLLTDGQIRWEDLVTPVAKRLDGFEIEGLARWFDNNTYYRRPILRSKPVRKRPLVVDEYRFAKGCTRRPVKAVLPGPYTFASMSEDRYFKAQRPFVLAMAEILNQEARALAEAGAPLVQFDEPAVGFGKPNMKLAVEALNVATRGLDVETAVYTYFGSLDGALEPLLRAKVDLVGIDVVSDPRALGALKKVKMTRRLGLGCLDARNTKLESVAELHALFDVVRKVVPQDQLYINPNCGLEFLPFEQASEKLKRLVEAVRTYEA